MFFSPSFRQAWPSKKFSPLCLASLFLGIQAAHWATSAYAAPPSAGVVIENQATGTFLNPADNSTNAIESNVVQVTVSEITGMTLTPAGVQEAPVTVNNPGPNQANGSLNAEDVVYFTFTATNVGNDPTQFFIPGSPSNLTNGTQAGQIEIIELDTDGPTGSTAPIDFSTLPFTIRPEGNLTGDATAMGLPVGAIPAGGTITLRVPVKLDAGLTGIDTVSLALGDVSPNDNSAATQNQDYSDGGNDLDFYTQDNLDTDNVTDEASGTPVNGDATTHRKEASASIEFSVGDAPSASYTLSGTVFADADGSNAQNSGETGLANVSVNLYIDVDNDGALTIADDSDSDGDIDADDAIANTITDSNGLYQFNRPNGNYLIAVDTNDSDLLEYAYGGLIGVVNDPLNLPRNADLAGANITTGLDFPFDGAPTNRDYGDAPDTGVGNGPGNYNTLATDNGPYHVIDSNLYIGTPPDEDTGNRSNVQANADELYGLPQDEGGVQFSFLKADDSGYSVDNISVVNNTGNTAYLVGWIDFDQSGTFDSDEAATTAVSSNGSQDTFLVWNSLPTDIVAGTTYARLRLTTDASVATGDATTSIPTGAASDGEVEDYQLTISTTGSPTIVDTCEVMLINSSFEAPNISVSPPNRFQSFTTNIASYLESDVPGWETTDPTNAIEIWRTGNFLFPAFEGLQFAELNANNPSTLSQDVVTVPGTVLTWQFAHRGRTGVDTMSLSIGPAGGTTVAQINSVTGTTSFSTGTSAWQLYQGTYTVPAGQTLTRFEFTAVSTANNNLSTGNFLDAIRFGDLCDHGDASTNYPVQRGGGGAAHINDGVTFLGNSVFSEPDGQPSTDATGDDNVSNDSDGNDDEDGVTFTSNLDTGTTATVDVTASSTGFLNAWIDFNQDGDWEDAGEHIFADEALTGGVNSLSFSVPTEASGGNTFSRFRFSQETGLAPTGIASSGEVEDYQVGVTAVVNDPNVLLVKRITRLNDNVTNTNDPGNTVQLDQYDEDSTYPYDDNVVEVTASPTDTDKWPNTTGDTASTFLIGARNGGNTEPGDEVEYTIYFLSAGDKDAQNVLFCDRIPDGQTFVPNPTFSSLTPAITAAPTSITGEASGILVSHDGNNFIHTNIGGDDNARFYPPGSGLPPACNLLPSQTEHNGAIVVDLGDLTQADTPGSPTDSYGFVRFRTTVNP